MSHYPSHNSLPGRNATAAHETADIDGLDTALAGKASTSHDHSGVYDPAGTAASAVSTHEGVADPHPGYVQESLFDANTMLYATVDNTPAALTIAASRIVGRKASGDIDALTAADVKTILAIAVTDITGLNTPNITCFPAMWIPTSITGTGTYGLTTANVIGDGYSGLSGTVADQNITWDVFLVAGTYTFMERFRSNAADGIALWKLDGSAIDGTGSDHYSASAVNDVVWTKTGVVVSTTGTHTVGYTNLTKNASSYAYRILVQGWSLTRTA